LEDALRVIRALQLAGEAEFRPGQHSSLRTPR
jgi:hypothetical protein